MARYGKLREAEVHYVTGMDEHGEKIARTAAPCSKGTFMGRDGMF